MAGFAQEVSLSPNEWRGPSEKFLRVDSLEKYFEVVNPFLEIWWKLISQKFENVYLGFGTKFNLFQVTVVEWGTFYLNYFRLNKTLFLLPNIFLASGYYFCSLKKHFYEKIQALWLRNIPQLKCMCISFVLLLLF